MRKCLVTVILLCSLSLSGCSFAEKANDATSVTSDVTEEEPFGLDYNNVQAISGEVYKVKANSSDFEWSLVEKSDTGIEYSTDVVVEKTGQSLAITGTKPGVAVIRLERDEEVLDEITFYTLGCVGLSKKQKEAVKAVTDGKIAVIAVDDGITTDYVDLVQKKLVLSSLPSIQVYAVANGKSYWIEIKDLESRIYYAFYSALEHLKTSDFAIYHPVTQLKYDVVRDCEERLFDMLPHLKGTGITGEGTHYAFDIKYKSLDNKEMPELVLDRSV